MASLQERYEEAMLEYSRGEYGLAMVKLRSILAEDAGWFDAQLALGMACCRSGDLASAIVEGRKAERLRPDEPLVHTNLSLFYLKAGDKGLAEHHAMRARMASWKEQLAAKGDGPSEGQAGRQGPEQGSGLGRAAGSTGPKPSVQTPVFPWKKAASGPAQKAGNGKASGG